MRNTLLKDMPRTSLVLRYIIGSDDVLFSGEAWHVMLNWHAMLAPVIMPCRPADFPATGSN
jgi:hypothetical protein